MNASKEQAHEASDRVWNAIRILDNMFFEKPEREEAVSELRKVLDFISACKSKLPCEKSYQKQKVKK